MGKRGHGLMVKEECATRRGEYCGGSNPTVPFLSRLGGLARSQISARIDARQSNKRCGSRVLLHVVQYGAGGGGG